MCLAAKTSRSVNRTVNFHLVAVWQEESSQNEDSADILPFLNAAKGTINIAYFTLKEVKHKFSPAGSLASSGKLYCIFVWAITKSK